MERLNSVAMQAEGARSSLSCNEGFVPVGPTTGTCTNDTTWQPDVLAFRCHSILDETNGTIIKLIALSLPK